jgi:branched-chain amino acid transport system permease protein
MGGALLAVAALFASGPLLGDYDRSILVQGMLFAVAAVTVDILWGYTGVLSYAQSVFFGLGAYGLAIYSVEFGFSWTGAVIAIVLSAVAACVVALLLGLLSFHSKADWLYVATVTFAATFAFEKVILAGGSLTGSSSGLSGFVLQPVSIDDGYRLSGLLLIAVTLGACLLVRSDAGRVMRAIRENEGRSQYLGIRVHRVKILLFAVAACVAAIAGSLYATTQNVVAPDLGGFQLGTAMVIWAAVGGRGTLLGPVGAAIGINHLNAYLSGSIPFLWQLVLGLVFVLVVTYAPGGAASLIGFPIRWLQSKLRVPGGSMPGGLLTVVPHMKAHEASARTTRPLLEVTDVSRSFGSFHAVKAVALAADGGEIVSIVGPNGAGKSTFMRCISDGGYRTSGSVRVAGSDIGRLTPDVISRLGVGQKFQTASVFASLSVFECLSVATRARRPSIWRRTSQLEIPAPAFEIIQMTGLDRLLHHTVSGLSHGQKQSLELAMVMCTEPRVILLDEPTAGLSQTERAAIGAVLRKIATDHLALLILVEHDLDFVQEISSRVLVLHHGELLMDGTVSEVVSSELVQEIYTGSPAGME